MRINGSTLIINNVMTDDSGIYTCVDDSERIHSIFLTVEAPKSVPRKTVTAVIGNRVTLLCRTTLSTPVDWYYRPSVNANGRTLCAAGNILNNVHYLLTEVFKATLALSLSR